MHSRPEQVADSCSCVSAFVFPPTQYCCAGNPWRVGTNVTRESELSEYDGDLPFLDLAQHTRKP